jgi:hypothetical protein
MPTTIHTLARALYRWSLGLLPLLLVALGPCTSSGGSSGY